MSGIEVKHLSKSFDQKGVYVEALKDINLSIKSGTIYGIIGMSGAGKSTLVRCLNYLEIPTSGQVLIDGKELGALSESELRKERSSIAMIFQHFNLLMQKNVIDNICFPLRLQGVKKKEAYEKARQLLKVVDLSEKEKAYPAQLSGGQKQRVAIARALASNPKILLCDEATSALDPQTTASILSLLKEINKNLGITIVIITHQMSVIREICHEVAIVEKGRLVEYGSVDEVFTHPKSAAAKELILRDLPEGGSDRTTQTLENLHAAKCIRIVFSSQSAFEPVISNLILSFGTQVNILKADTKNVSGVAKGEMVLGLPEDTKLQEDIQIYLRERGLEVEEVDVDVFERCN
ncbi:Methionine ABC transporter ATP-binding protein [Lachnospiraceae bacterium TWA4]|nr:Methionine ABC transporter ATP-binding protein [Lachnospiraceae bacterium TWA4]